MARTAQRSIDGMGFSHYKARMTGSVDLEELEADACIIGDVIVTVDVKMVKDIQAKVDKEGDLTRVAVLQSTDTRVLAGEYEDLKNLLVERLGLYGTDTVGPVLITHDNPRREPAPEAVDPETGEIADPGDDERTRSWVTPEAREQGTHLPREDQDESLDEEEDDFGDEPVVLGHVGRRDPTAEGGRVGMANVLPYSERPDSTDVVEAGAEVVGKVGRSDSALSKFLSET